MESVHSLGFSSTLLKKMQEDEKSSLTEESRVSPSNSPSEIDVYVENLSEDKMNLYTRSQDRRASVLLQNSANKENLHLIKYFSFLIKHHFHLEPF